MLEIRKLVVFVVITLPFAIILCLAKNMNSEPNAAELVRKVREDENWVHKIDSLFIRIESKWTRTSEGVAARQASSNEQCEECSESKQDSGLVLSSDGILEYAIDEGRVRFFDFESELWNTLTVWNGKQLIAYERFDQKEHYNLNWTPQGCFEEMIAFQTSWLRTQPHSFWWDRKDVDELIGYYGRDIEFTVVGRSDYRGVDCYILEFVPRDLWGLVTGQSYRCDSGIADRYQFGLIGEARGLIDQAYHWYVGVKDHRLYGLVWLVMQKPHVEHWMSDYKEVGPGRLFPMTQGYALYKQDDDGKHYLVARRDLNVLDVRVNEKLPDNLFEIELQRGIQVYDGRSGHQIVYKYKPEPPNLVGKAMPDLGDFQFDSAFVQKNNQMVLQCFWDVQQRPSRHCINQIAKQAEQLKQKDINVIAIQVSKVNKKSLEEWLKENNIPLFVGMINSDEEQILFNWGVKSLPWLILTDKEHIVMAEGFSLSELGVKIEQINGD